MKSESDKKDPLPNQPHAIKPQQIIPPTTRNSSSLTSNGLQDDKHPPSIETTLPQMVKNMTNRYNTHPNIHVHVIAILHINSHIFI